MGRLSRSSTDILTVISCALPAAVLLIALRSDKTLSQIAWTTLEIDTDVKELVRTESGHLRLYRGNYVLEDGLGSEILVAAHMNPCKVSDLLLSPSRESTMMMPLPRRTSSLLYTDAFQMVFSAEAEKVLCH